MLNIISAYIVLDAVHGVNTGIVRALHKQFMASIATLCCYYLFGMPLALLLGFRMDMGVKGFWLGFTFALIAQDVIISVIIVLADWNVTDKEEGDVSVEVRKRLIAGTGDDADDEFFDSEKFVNTYQKSTEMTESQSQRTLQTSE